jgi:hypothetical protein
MHGHDVIVAFHPVHFAASDESKHPEARVGAAVRMWMADGNLIAVARAEDAKVGRTA